MSSSWGAINIFTYAPQNAHELTFMMNSTLAGIVNRLELNVPNPRLVRVRVMYAAGGPCGMYPVSPIYHCVSHVKGWRRSDVTHKVQRPGMIICETLPDQAHGNGLPVVHISFGGVIPQYSVDHDDLLPLCEPALAPTEPGGSLGRRGWHHPEGQEANGLCVAKQYARIPNV